MAYFSHTNDRRKIGHDPLTLGSFSNAETGAFFEFADRHSAPSCAFCSFDWADKHEFPHVIATTDGKRYARVRKTVAYVVIDEDDSGQPVVEKWKIKGRREFASAQ